MAQAPTTVPAAAPPAAPQTRELLIQEVDRSFETFQREHPTPGLVYGIVQDGRLIHVRGYGAQELAQRRPVGPDTLFRIASMSKAFTALAILKLRDEGKVQLDALAEKYVPEMRGWKYPTSDSPRIRVRDLLAHVGGLVTDDPWGDRQQVLTPAEFTRMISEGPPFTRSPQLSMEYSNYGYALLGRIVTNASGRPYQRYIVEEIMRPLGMTSTGYDVVASPQERRAIGYRWENDQWVLEPTMRDGEFGAMGGVQTSANDYAKWMAFLLSACPARDGPETGPVKRSTVREMAQGLNYPGISRRPGFGGGEPCAMARAYAMGLISIQDCDLGTVLTHSGGYPGYGSFMMFMPERNAGVFAFTNRTYTAPAPQVNEAAVRLARGGFMPTRQVPVSDALKRMYDLAGDIYARGNLGDADNRLAMNFLLDRSAENWARELAGIKAAVGACETSSPIVANGAMAGNFDWQCERGRLQGQVLLAPTRPPTIQALRFRPVPSQTAQ
ncbi:MAG TPA: serine hydrolase domain-containing protein [Allosphingosinicella sp.]|nr:serine hydrolase domain-containing protein [Allosphingosinicella sp.]